MPNMGEEMEEGLGSMLSTAIVSAGKTNQRIRGDQRGKAMQNRKTENQCSSDPIELRTSCDFQSIGAILAGVSAIKSTSWDI